MAGTAFPRSSSFPPSPSFKEGVRGEVEPNQRAGSARRGEARRALPDEGGREGPPLDDVGYRIGMRVRHAQFGTGEVKAWSGQGSLLRLTVFFPNAGVKTIVARYLERV